MKILYVTSEASPFASSGGLGDVMGALPKEVAKKGEEVSVILPLYDTVLEKYRDDLIWVSELSFPLSWRNTRANIYRIEKDGVNYYFVDNEYYFRRRRLYGEYDDGERFAFFSRAVIEFILDTRFTPDILHANDWHSALTVIYLKTLFCGYKLLQSVKTVFTIHNIEYQGKYDSSILSDVFGLDYKDKNITELHGDINLMKGGIVTADAVTTVSPNYKNELQHDFFAYGLSDIIKANAGKITGILNGIDYSVFSPEHGGDIYLPYNKKNYKNNKPENKRLLTEELGLSSDEKTPLAVMITRLASQKGIELFLHIADELLCERIQVVVLGTGEEKYESELRALQQRHGNFKAIIDFDRALAKKLYASSDIFLMPSRFEPCGLSQMIACSYGSVPIVRSVGGLYDTITPYGEEGANGFRFDNFNAHEFLFTIKLATEVYNHKEEWDKLVSSALNCVFSWDNSANEYISIYRNLLN